MTTPIAGLSFPPHVQQAIDEGKLWRAKEILRGRIGSEPFAPALYEQYGVILLAMDDLLQAGKYLFVSGARRAEYEESIALYLSRHGSRDGKILASSFPAKPKALELSALPLPVRDKLLELGFPAVLADKQSVGAAALPFRRKVTGAAAFVGCLLVLVFGGICLVVGFTVVVKAIGAILRTLF